MAYNRTSNQQPQVISSKVERCIDIADTADRYRYDLPNICPGGEIGKHTRLRSVALRVRVPPRAPVMASLWLTLRGPNLQVKGSIPEDAAIFANK